MRDQHNIPARETGYSETPSAPVVRPAARPAREAARRRPALRFLTRASALSFMSIIGICAAMNALPTALSYAIAWSVILEQRETAPHVLFGSFEGDDGAATLEVGLQWNFNGADTAPEKIEGAGIPLGFGLFPGQYLPLYASPWTSRTGAWLIGRSVMIDLQRDMIENPFPRGLSEAEIKADVMARVEKIGNGVVNPVSVSIGCQDGFQALATTDTPRQSCFERRLMNILGRIPQPRMPGA